MEDIPYIIVQPYIARQYGVHEALIFGFISGWCDHNRKKRIRTAYHDGTYWMYTTHGKIGELLGISRHTVHRAMQKLLDAGLVIQTHRPGKSGTRMYFKCHKTIV